MVRNPEVERAVRVPAVDIYEHETGMLLVADLPGVNEDGLEVHVEQNRLILRGRVRPAPKSVSVHLDEIGAGDFLREFQISADLDANEVVAEFRNGVVRLEIPRSKECLPRKIEIRTS
jgi:HSP20 family molecular chaperone IbpA